MVVDIDINEVTTGSLDGSGVFDKLMAVTKVHIAEEFETGRIKGPEYASLYLGALQSVMAHSIEFVFREQVTEKEVELRAEQIISERINQNATKAKAEDEYGAIISDLDDGISFSTSDNTKHYWAVKNAEQAYEKSLEDVKAAKENVDILKMDNISKEAILDREYDFSVDKTTWSISPKNSVTDGINVDTFIPKSRYGLDILKGRVEATVATNTAKGYEADSFYKVYRSLQELLFALTNAGLIDEGSVPGSTAPDAAAIGTYGRIVLGMEAAMNGQVKVWDPASNGIVDLNGSGVNNV